MTTEDEGPAARRRLLFVRAAAFDMTREERIELAEYVLRRDISSWKDLTDQQVCRMLDVLEGAALVIHMLGQRPGHAVAGTPS
jgi:hypothetical protein